MSIEIAYLSDRTPAECYVYDRWQLGLPCKGYELPYQRK
jgi:hypothetical protein